MIRLRLPELNEERRKELVKVAHKYAEAAARRGAPCPPRRHGRAQENGKGPPDQRGRPRRGFPTEVQKATDQAIADIDHLLAAKEKEIMTV